MTDDANKMRSSTWERAYPEDLRKSEERLVRRRHGKCNSCGDSAETGLALSGGGIRSATFGFGVNQALAGLDLLAKIDVLSTVSGGGYTGSLLSRLFTRKEVNSHEDVKRVILPAHTSDDAPQEFPSGWVLRWLRENGRYLAPNGSGDLLLGGAIVLRNWLSIHLVLTTLALTLFVAMQCIRNGLHIGFSGATVPLFLTCSANGAAGAAPLANLEAWLSCHLPLGETYVWWSPWLLLPAFIFVFAAVPLGWVYWLLADDGRQTPKGRSGVLCALCGPVIVVAGTTLVYAATRILDIDRLAPFLPAATVFLFVAVVTIFVALFSVIRRRYRAKDADDAPNYRVRHRLSSWLKTVLVLFAATLGLAVVDSLGQTVYVMWEDPGILHCRVARGDARPGDCCGKRTTHRHVFFGPERRPAAAVSRPIRTDGRRAAVLRDADRNQRTVARYRVELQVPLPRAREARDTDPHRSRTQSRLDPVLQPGGVTVSRFGETRETALYRLSRTWGALPFGTSGCSRLSGGAVIRVGSHVALSEQFHSVAALQRPPHPAPTSALPIPVAFRRGGVRRRQRARGLRTVPRRSPLRRSRLAMTCQLTSIGGQATSNKTKTPSRRVPPASRERDH